MGLLSLFIPRPSMSRPMRPYFRILPALCCVIPAPVFAGDTAPAAADAAAQPQTPRLRFRAPEDGKLLLSTVLAHPRAFLPIPLVVTEPAVGYGGGVAGMFVRPRKDAGSDGYARPNISVAGGLATENGTWMAFAGDSSH